MTRLLKLGADSNVESVGDQLLVKSILSPEVLVLSGDIARQVKRNSASGEAISVEDHVAQDLLASLAFEEVASGLSRRGVAKLAVAGIGGGIVSMTLPSVGFASSLERVIVEKLGRWSSTNEQFLYFQNQSINEILPPEGDPGPLRVFGLSIPLNEIQREDGSFDLFWEGPGSNLSTENVVGEFDWDGKTYVITFEWESD